MWQALRILSAAGFTVAAAAAAGRLALRPLALRLYRGEELLFSFLVGFACLGVLVFALAAGGLVYPGVLLACGAILIGACIGTGAYRPAGKPLPAIPALWKIVFLTGFTIFAVIYVLHAMAPEFSPEGTGRRLVFVARYAREHGLARAGADLRGGLPQGMEMLFLCAFVLGRHSAAALVHFAYVLVLPLLMLSYARRMGAAKAGVFGALFTFASPLVGVDGSSAAGGVALASTLFALFYLLEIWDGSRRHVLLIPAAFLAGWAGLVAYAGMLGAPFACVFVAWRLLRARQPVLRPLAVLTLLPAVMVSPWLARNWMLTGNPASPFLNGLFPNQAVSGSLESEYLRVASGYPAARLKLEIPIDAAILGGPLEGVAGPLFLLAPVALLALRTRMGRRLLVASAVFGAPYAAGVETHCLVALPFLSLAMGLALAGTRVLAPALLGVHLLLSYPNLVSTYCDPGAWRIESTWFRAAFRLRPEESFLASRLPAYAMVSRLDRLIPPGGKVFSMHPLPQVYASREVLVAAYSERNRGVLEAMRIALQPARRPTRRMILRFPPARLRGVRVSAASGAAAEWEIYEFRLFFQGRELPRAPEWRLRAHPNPWAVQLAFDNSPVTFWRSGSKRSPGMRVEAALNSCAELDTVTLDTSPDQGPLTLRFEALPETGAWKDLPVRVEERDVVRPAGLRRAAILECKAAGAGYMLVEDSDFEAWDFQERPALWGITEIARARNLRLYRLN